MSLFRKEAIEEKRRRLWGEVRLAQPPTLTIWTIVLSLLCAVIFTVLLLGRYTRKETVPGFLIPEAGVVQLRPLQGGRVERVLVREGDKVLQGTPLIEFTSDVASVGHGPVLDVQIAETGRQRLSLAERQAAIRQEFVGEQKRIKEQIVAQVRLKAILAAQREVQVDALVLAEADLARLSRLQQQGYAPNSEVDRRRQMVLSQRNAVADMDTRMSATDATVAELRSQAAAIPARQAEILSGLASDGAALAQRLAELQVARGYILRAPVAGTISALQVRRGMTPAPDQLLLSIAPTQSALEAHLIVPTRAAGFLKVGQRARLQVEAFPFQRFGFVEGRIVDVARTVTRPGEALFPIVQTEAGYEVRVSLEKDYVTAYGERRLLRPGMALKADLPIDRRQLWQQLFDPILAARQRSGG